MPTVKENTKKKSWLRRMIPGWHAFVVDVLHYGPLAMREIVDEWCLAIGVDWKVGDGKRVASRELQRKRDCDTDRNVP